jgi:hypothetical protein
MKLLLYAEAVFRIPEDILQAALGERWSAGGLDLAQQVQVVVECSTFSPNTVEVLGPRGLGANGL